MAMSLLDQPGEDSLYVVWFLRCSASPSLNSESDPSSLTVCHSHTCFITQTHAFTAQLSSSHVCECRCFAVFRWRCRLVRKRTHETLSMTRGNLSFPIRLMSSSFCSATLPAISRPDEYFDLTGSYGTHFAENLHFSACIFPFWPQWGVCTWSGPFAHGTYFCTGTEYSFRTLHICFLLPNKW